LTGIIELCVVRSDLKEGWIEVAVSEFGQMGGVEGINLTIFVEQLVVEVVGVDGCLLALLWEGDNRGKF
jgi:hypothetical protein